MAWSRAQAGVVGNTGSGTGPNTATFGSNITAGNLVLWQCTWGTTATTDLTSVTSGGATATVKARVVDATNGQSFGIGYFINHPGAVKTVVQNVSTGVIDLQMLVSEFTGTNVSTATNSGGTVVVQGSPATTTDGVKTGTTFGLNGDLRWGCAQEDGASSAGFTAGTGYTADKIDTTDASFFGLSSATEWMTATGAADVTFTFGTSGTVGVGGLSFTPGGGGGTTYNDTVSESITSGDSLAVAVTYRVSFSEAVTTADSLLPAATYNVAFTDAATVADALSAGLAYAVSISESITAGDAVSVSAVWAASFTEALAPTDSLSAITTYGVSIAEALTLLDSLLAEGTAQPGVWTAHSGTPADWAAGNTNKSVWTLSNGLSSKWVVASAGKGVWTVTPVPSKTWAKE